VCSSDLTVFFNRDVAGALDLALARVEPLLPAAFRVTADGFVALAAGFAFFVPLRFAGFVGASIAPHTSVTAETVARRSFLVAFARVRLNGSNI
jgi:hypothetical protein